MLFPPTELASPDAGLCQLAANCIADAALLWSAGALHSQQDGGPAVSSPPPSPFPLPSASMPSSSLARTERLIRPEVWGIEAFVRPDGPRLESPGRRLPKAWVSNGYAIPKAQRAVTLLERGGRRLKSAKSDCHGTLTRCSIYAEVILCCRILAEHRRNRRGWANPCSCCVMRRNAPR